MVQVLMDSVEAAKRLAVFGLEMEGLQEVARKAAAARSDSVPNDPVNAPGTFAYIYGVRALREALLPLEGWEADRSNGMEGVYNKDRGIRILYQNVHRACAAAEPRPISSKGEGAKRMLDNQSFYLWQDMQDEADKAKNREVWYLCVSVDGDEVRAEISRPAKIVNGQFSGFIERIAVLQGGESPLVDPRQELPADEVQDFIIEVTRK